MLTWRENAASMAAATVPEESTLMPALGPEFRPLTAKAGGAGRSVRGRGAAASPRPLTRLGSPCFSSFPLQALLAQQVMIVLGKAMRLVADALQEAQRRVSALQDKRLAVAGAEDFFFLLGQR